MMGLDGWMMMIIMMESKVSRQRCGLLLQPATCFVVV